LVLLLEHTRDTTQEGGGKKRNIKMSTKKKTNWGEGNGAKKGGDTGRRFRSKE